MKLMPLFTLVAWPFLGYGAIVAWDAGWWPLTVVLTLAASVCVNSTFLTMHESVHFLLSSNRRWNDVAGIVSGTVTLAPMSLFRVVHTSHHGLIGTDNDLEFWPYVNKGSKRWQRVLAALTELTVAPVYYMCMFTRALLIGHMSPRARARCYRDVGIMTVALVVGLYFVAANGWWVEFTIGYLIPLTLAANMQSWRRLTEHVGLYGDDPLSLTRTIIPTNPVERLYCRIMLNENYHAPHHKKATIKWTDLPAETMAIYEARPDLRGLFFTTYLKAFPHMLKELGDPRIGAQWLRHENGEAPTLRPATAA